MQARAEARYIRISPQKARLVVDLIRGQNGRRGAQHPAQTNKRIAPSVEKVLRFGHRQCRESQRTTWTWTSCS